MSLKHIKYIFLLFCLIFSFRIPIIYNSAILAFILSIVNLLYVKRVRCVIQILKKRYVARIFISLLLLIIAVILIAGLHQTYDFYAGKTFISQFITLFCAVPVLALICNDYPAQKIHKLLIEIFILQSVIQLLCIVSPPLLEFIRKFQDPWGSEIAEGYGGVRGLALASELYFSLAFCYGLMYIIYTKYLLDKKPVSLTDIICFIILIIGTFFAGRTGFVGLGFAIVLFLFYRSRFLFKFNAFMKLLMVTVAFVVIAISSLPSGIISFFNDKVLPFAFEFVYSYFEDGKMETASTNRLGEMLETSISFKTFFVGDGRYVNADGSYYMHTDSGYFRPILFGGIFFLISLVAYHNLLIVYPKNRLKSKNKLCNENVFIFVLVGYLLVGQIKGEVIGNMKYCVTIMFVYFFPYYWEKLKYQARITK